MLHHEVRVDRPGKTVIFPTATLLGECLLDLLLQVEDRLSVFKAIGQQVVFAHMVVVSGTGTNTQLLEGMVVGASREGTGAENRFLRR